MNAARADRTRHWVVLALAIILTLANAATWLLAEITCNLSESDEMDQLCGGTGTLGRTTLALLAAAAVPVTYALARWTGRLSIFTIGAIVAVFTCGSVWLWSA